MLNTKPKRVGFVSIQQEHAIACDGYHQSIIRTGYDTIVPHRTIDLFAATAKKPGVVRKVSPTGIIVDYDDGNSQGFEIGRRYGNAQGLTVAHDVITPLKEGDRFEVGDPISYNTGFFEPDFFDPRKIVWKNSINVRTVLWESAETLEDSSVISKRVSEKLVAKTTKVKWVVMKFKEQITDLVKPGTVVNADTVLCTIQDEVSANSGLFDEKSLETLRTLEAQTPRAHVKGVVDRVEVYYHGDKEDMSESVRAICNESDRNLKQRLASIGEEPVTGQVDGGMRIDNDPLGFDTIAIKIYITSSVKSGVGD